MVSAFVLHLERPQSPNGTQVGMVQEQFYTEPRPMTFPHPSHPNPCCVMTPPIYTDSFSKGWAGPVGQLALFYNMDHTYTCVENSVWEMT